jgi:hypothetical protein
MTVQTFLEHRGFARHADGWVRCACSAELVPQHMSVMAAERAWIRHLHAVEGKNAAEILAELKARAAAEPRPELCDSCGEPHGKGVGCRFAKKFMLMFRAVRGRA